MAPSKIRLKNVDLYCEPIQAKDLQDLLADPINRDLNVSLAPILETDANGLITVFRPITNMSLGLLFALQQLMVAQRIYLIDEFLREQGIIK